MASGACLFSNLAYYGAFVLSHMGLSGLDFAEHDNFASLSCDTFLTVHCRRVGALDPVFSSIIADEGCLLSS